MTPRNGHPAILARNDLLTIADTWPDLVDRLSREDGASDGQPRAKNRTPGLVINDHVSQVMADIRSWVTFLARVLIDETDWRPDDSTVPGMLRGIATRVGHFTTHDDEQLRDDFTTDTATYRDKATNAAYPTGRHMLWTQIRCDHHDTSDQGERIPCTGRYGVLVDPDRSLLPDMVCEKDRTHRISPLDWQRAYRRTAMNPNAAAALAARINGGAA
jgi:hypothetical protein